MMVLKINGTKFDKFNSFEFTLSYDSVASAFSFDLYFDPKNADHKKALMPGTYHGVTIEHNGELLLTGTLLSVKFKSSSEKNLVSVTGYSIPGVLEDCEIPKEAYPLQTSGLSLRKITERIIKPFGLNLVIDPTVAARADESITSSTANDSDTCKSYISKLAGHKQIMLTHDEKGNLVMTEAKINQIAIFDFSAGAPGLEIEFSFDGQKMHSSVTMQKQATKRGKGNAGVSTISNPYVQNAFRPKVHRQTSGKDVDTNFAARNIFSDELQGMPLTISMDRWELSGKIARPNNLITITNPEIFLYKKTIFFISSVKFQGDESSQTAVLECVLPECFTNTMPKNIFL